MNNKAVFHEVQYQPMWLRIIMLGVGAIIFIIMYQQVMLGYSIGTHPAPDWLMIVIWAFVGVLLPLFASFSRLEIQVNDKGVYYRFFPLQPRFIFIPFSGISSIEALTFNPLWNTGGWGIRWGLGGICYLVRGNQGVRFTLDSGKRILLGSQRSNELFEITEEKRKRHLSS